MSARLFILLLILCIMAAFVMGFMASVHVAHAAPLTPVVPGPNPEPTEPVSPPPPMTTPTGTATATPTPEPIRTVIVPGNTPTPGAGIPVRVTISTKHLSIHGERPLFGYDITIVTFMPDGPVMTVYHDQGHPDVHILIPPYQSTFTVQPMREYDTPDCGKLWNSAMFQPREGLRLTAYFYFACDQFGDE